MITLEGIEVWFYLLIFLLFGFAVGWGLRSAYYDFWKKQRRKNK